MNPSLLLSLVLSFLVVLQPTAAQTNYTLSGTVTDAQTGEALLGVNVLVKELGTGTPTDLEGFYKLTLPAATYTLEYSFIGYGKVSREINLNRNTRLNISLRNDSAQLQEVVVTQDNPAARVQSLEMSVAKLDARTITKVPAFLGEPDVIKSLQLLPGVSTVGEGASGFNVRGGSVGQNLVLQDDAPIYNSSHLLGFFSAFNPDAVQDLKLYKGGIPPRYGGRLASILDVRLRDGDYENYTVSGGVGTVFSRLAVEGPIIKEKASFLVGARRSYIDVLARPFVDILKEGGALNFYDLTGKASYKFNPRNKLSLSGYYGRDNFFFDKQQGFNWGNSSATLAWTHLFSDRFFATFSGVFSRYDYELQFGDTPENIFRWTSNLNNYIFKPDFTYQFSPENEVNFGAEATYYNISPANATGASGGGPIDFTFDKKYSLESGLYANHNLKLNQVFSVGYGLRYSNFQLFGPGTVYTYDSPRPGIRKTVVSSEEFGSGKAIASYNNLEPRLTLKAGITQESSIKASYNRMVQYLHFVSNTTASNPLDIWVPSSNNLKPQTGNQYTLGYFRNIKSRWEVSAEVYLRQTDNQIDYIDGAELLLNEFLEGDVLSGRGRAYGLEFYVRKTSGRLNGWVSYTMARTQLQVAGINRGEWYNTRFDQLHNLKVTAFYDLNERLSFSGNFVFTSGTPTTFPTSRYVVQGVLIPHNATESRNNVRLPGYHRLDLSVRLEGRKTRKGKERRNQDYWVFSVYNAYARKNPFSIYFAQAEGREVPGNALQSEARQLSIIGTVVPAVSYNFSF